MSASGLVWKAVWPSCQRNSRVRRKGSVGRHGGVWARIDEIEVGATRSAIATSSDERRERKLKRTGVLELPTNHRVPLVELERKIAVGADPLNAQGNERDEERDQLRLLEQLKRKRAHLGVVGVHDRLGGRTNSDRLLEVRLAAVDGGRGRWSARR